MNDFDRNNERIRREGRVFEGGRNNTRCSRCGAFDAEYQGNEDDEGNSIATCVGGCPDDDWYDDAEGGQ